MEPTAGMAAYAVSKAALVHLTRVLDLELRPLGIRVNAVAPQLLDTAKTRPYLPPDLLAHAVTPEAVAGLSDGVARLPVGRDERDPQRFWLAVLDALRATPVGSGLVHGLTAAPDLDGRAILERLLKDLAPLDDQLWLVVDDVHELRSDQSAGPAGAADHERPAGAPAGAVHPA